jgi:hypothetical protein
VTTMLNCVNCETTTKGDMREPFFNLTAQAITAVETIKFLKKGSFEDEPHVNEFNRCMMPGCDETRENKVVATKVEAPVKS